MYLVHHSACASGDALSACLRTYGVSERDPRALCGARDQAVAESGIAAAALRQHGHRLIIDESDSTALAQFACRWPKRRKVAVEDVPENP